MDLDDIYIKFEKWALNNIKKEKPSKDIKAYNFGIFKTKVGFSLYLMGAKKYDANNDDWACTQDYAPADQYFDFPKDYTKDKSSEDMEKELVTLVTRFTKNPAFKDSFLDQAEGLTAGFDDEDLHTIKR